MFVWAFVCIILRNFDRIYVSRNASFRPKSSKHSFFEHCFQQIDQNLSV